MSGPYRTPGKDCIPSIFEVRDGEYMVPELAVPGTPFVVATICEDGFYDLAVLRDGQIDRRLTKNIRRRYYGEPTNAKTAHQMGWWLLACAREEDLVRK